MYWGSCETVNIADGGPNRHCGDRPETRQVDPTGHTRVFGGHLVHQRGQTCKHTVIHITLQIDSFQLTQG